MRGALVILLCSCVCSLHAQETILLENGVSSPPTVLNDTIKWRYYKYVPTSNDVTVVVNVATSLSEQFYVKVGSPASDTNYDYVHERDHDIIVHPCAGLSGDIFIAVTHWACFGTCDEDTGLTVKAQEQTRVDPLLTTVNTNFTIVGNDGLSLFRVDLPAGFDASSHFVTLNVPGAADRSWDTYLSENSTCPTFQSRQLHTAPFPTSEKLQFAVPDGTVTISFGIRMWVAESIVASVAVEPKPACQSSCVWCGDDECEPDPSGFCDLGNDRSTLTLSRCMVSICDEDHCDLCVGEFESWRDIYGCPALTTTGAVVTTTQPAAATPAPTMAGSGGTTAAATTEGPTSPPTTAEEATSPPTTPEPAPTTFALKVKSTLGGVTAEQLKANLDGFKEAVAGVHDEVSPSDVEVDEDSIVDVTDARRRLLADGVAVEYEVGGFSSQAAATAAKEVQEGASTLEASLKDAGFDSLTSLSSTASVVDDSGVIVDDSAASALGFDIRVGILLAAAGLGLARC